MYKIMSKNKIVDVLTRIHYFRILSSGHVAYTNRTASIGFVGSDGTTLYSSDARVLEMYPHINEGHLVGIDEPEYVYLKEQLVSRLETKEDNNLISARETKINEMSEKCSKSIVNGVSIVLQDGKEHHFRLTPEDQLNLLFAHRAIENGEMYILYHETASTCRLFSSTDMKCIINAADKHRQYHTTYFNLLKHCINTMNTVEEINQVFYGIDLQEVGISPEVKVLLSGV